MAEYYSGLACQNGHAISSGVELGFSSNHCEDCGAAAVASCQNCKTSLRGSYKSGLSTSKWCPPAFCHGCGAPFPWTLAKIGAVRELTDAIDELTAHERNQLLEFLPHILADTPRTEPAAFKAAAIIGRITGPGKKVLYDLLINLAADGAKRVLAGG